MPPRSWRVSGMRSLRNLKDNRVIRTAVLIVLSLLAAVSIYQGVRNALSFSQDFQWDAAKALAMRLDPYELSLHPKEAAKIPGLDAFYRFFTDRGLTQEMEANQFPSLLMLLIPMTFLPPVAAKAVWCVCNLLFTAGIIYLLKRTFFEDADRYTFSVLMLIMLAGTPYRNQIGVGQHTLFAFFFFMLAVWIEKRDTAGKAKNTILISACLAVSYFKYTLTAPLALYFVWKRRYKELIWSVAVHIVLTGAAALWLGKSFIYMIKAPLEVASALVSEGGIDLGVLLGGKIAYAVAFVIMAALTVMAFYLPKEHGRLLFALLVLWSLVLTYHRTYDFFVLSAVACMFFEMLTEGRSTDRDRFFIYAYAVLVLMIYFVLRLFGESTPSKICAGVMYYAFTVAVTARSVKLIKEKKDHG